MRKNVLLKSTKIEIFGKTNDKCIDIGEDVPMHKKCLKKDVKKQNIYN